jgi:N-acetylglucosamine-6-phosphate deacetylase
MEILGRWYDTGAPLRIVLDGDRIGNVEDVAMPAEQAEGLPWVAPGLIDLQLNGYAGQEFSSSQLTVERIAEIVDATAPMGVTQFLPTLTTHTLDTLTHGLRLLDQACREDRRVASRVAGIHLEGPYVSPQDGPRGAHPLANCRRPDWDEFCRLQEAAGGRIRIHTVSPEFEEAFDFINKVAESGVIVSLGHTAATPEQIRRAADAGATMSTHLGNGSHPMLPRHRNYLWAQMADDRLTAGLIADGHHLPPEVVKSMVRAKEPGRCVLVSDLSGYAGLAPGRYQTQLCKLEILAGGKLVVAGQQEILAGASLPLCEGVANAMDFAGIDLATAVNMASRKPAELLGLEPICAQVGSRADFIVFQLPQGPEYGSRRMELRETIFGGETIWKEER